jgi:DNA invertase Pin-like site-specific DNA recombinase
MIKMKIGYARVSTQDQDLALQLDALQAAGCGKIYKEKMTGSTRDRPELQKLLDQLREGDVVVIWKLDRLARSLKDLVNLVNEIQEKGGALHSLNDQIDTTTPHGKFTFHVFAALAEFERDIIRERTKAGLTAARARGRVGGRPKGLSKKAQHTAIIAERLYQERELTVKEICEQLSISRGTLYNYLRFRGVAIASSPTSNKGG